MFCFFSSTNICYQLRFWLYSLSSSAVADSVFFRGGCTNSQIGIIFQFFCRKLHENERIWTPRGARVPDAPLDPPMPVYTVFTSTRLLFRSFALCFSISRYKGHDSLHVNTSHSLSTFTSVFLFSYIYPRCYSIVFGNKLIRKTSYVPMALINTSSGKI